MAPPRISALKVSERLATGISLGESHFREFKSATDRSSDPPKRREVKLVSRDIAETLVAFANADGGELYVGVEDDGSVSGVDYPDPQFAMLTEAYKTHVLPGTPLPSPTIARVSYEGKTVLYFQVAKSTERVHQTSDARCLQRFDRENRPVPAEEIQYTRQEQRSREYDRVFVDGANLQDLDVAMIDAISREHAGGQSPEKFLQYMDLAEYGSDGLRLRRAALLLFARDAARWHPRCEVRVVRVSGLTLGVGKEYNVSPRDDQTIRGNILHILQTAWDTLRPYLTQTKLIDSGIFRENLVYPEEACREGLINAVAHRDYSIEGKGIEILIFDDRLEVKSPGGLLSSISLDDLRTGKRTHQSRNAYLARVLREFGYMREMGEGMLRIFRTMRDRDLVPPELEADAGKFDVVLHHRSVFSPKDQEWLAAYAQYNLSRDEQRTILLGRDGHHLSMNEITKALAIVDTDEFRKLIEHLRRKGILYNAARKLPATASRHRREVGKFAIRPPDQTEQYRQELLGALQKLGPRPLLSISDLAAIKSQLSKNSPFVEALHESLKLLGFADERLRPHPSVGALWKDFVAPISEVADKRTSARSSYVAPVALSSTEARLVGTVDRLKMNEGYGFLTDTRGTSYFFHVTSLSNRSDWNDLREGTRVTFEVGIANVQNKPRPAIRVRRATA